MFFKHLRIYKNCRLTTPDHMVDHEWSVEVPRFSQYIWVSIGAVFQGEYDGGGAYRGACDHSCPDGRQ